MSISGEWAFAEQDSSRFVVAEAPGWRVKGGSGRVLRDDAVQPPHDAGVSGTRSSKSESRPMSSAAGNQSPIVDHWYYKVGGQEFGPITSSQLKELAKRGTLGHEDLVRQRTVTSWTKAKQVKGLFPAEGWFAKIADQEYGPMSSQELVGLAKQLRLGPDDDVRRSDQMNWTKANRVQGLFGVSDGPTNVKKQSELISNSISPRSLTHQSTGSYPPSDSSTATASNPPVQSGMSASSSSSQRSTASARRKRASVSWQKLSLGAFAIVGMIWGGLVFFATPPQAEQEPTVVALKPSIAEKKNPEPRPISNVKAHPFTAETLTESKTPQPIGWKSLCDVVSSVLPAGQLDDIPPQKDGKRAVGNIDFYVMEANPGVSFGISIDEARSYTTPALLRVFQSSLFSDSERKMFDESIKSALASRENSDQRIGRFRTVLKLGSKGRFTVLLEDMTTPGQHNQPGFNAAKRAEPSNGSLKAELERVFRGQVQIDRVRLDREIAAIVVLAKDAGYSDRKAIALFHEMLANAKAQGLDPIQALFATSQGLAAAAVMRDQNM